MSSTSSSSSTTASPTNYDVFLSFRENYASSRRCLDELVKIIECMKTMDRKVLPIFYHVEPTHVRKQEGNFGEAFKQLKERFTDSEDRVEKWRSALTEAADLSGEISSNNRHESELIEEVAEHIMKKLFPISFIASNQLVGMDVHIQRIQSCLEMGSIGVSSVGLWGMSGVGKTTIAEIVYGQISYQFEHCCFFRNIGEESEKIGFVALRNKFFYKLLGIETPDGGLLCVLTAFIADKLSRSKVLVVFDDITDLNQLEAFGVGEGWFGPGSRIIITSRDKQVLNIVDEIYEVEGLHRSDALQLFSMKAFKQMHPQKGYEELSEKVVNYAGGVPLALIVLGSHLYKRLLDEWELQLNKLKHCPEPSIQRILKISYDELEEDMLKDIFLDIACFFKGCVVDSVRDILDGWGLIRLSEKCLITIRDNTLEMHDLVQEMGRDIARRRGNLLWNHEDIYHLLTTDMRNEAVEGILLDMSKVENVPLSSTALDISHSMPNLRLLKFYRQLFWKKKQDPVFTVESSQSNNLLQLPHKLRLLHWEEYPFESLPLNFFMQNLVDLTLLDSNVIHLWDGKGPENLKRLDLSHSVQLRRLPDLSSATKMEKICLMDCQSLVEIPHSIQCLHNLTDLFMHWCTNLRSIPNMATLISLRRLNLSYCPNLKVLPEIPKDIEWIELENSGFEGWSSVPFWENVTALNMKNCKNLASLPSLVHLKSLGILNLAGCSNLTMLPEIPNCIKRLELQKSGIVEWPPGIGNLENLRFLDVSFCKKMRSFPSLTHSKSLHTIYLQGCINLKIFPEIQSSIKILELKNSGLEDLRCCFSKFPDFTGNLEKLILDERAIRELPSSIKCFSSSLHELSMRKCKILEILPDSICELKSLQTLDLSDCSKLTKLPPLNGLNSLKRLVLNGTAIVEIPAELPSSLIEWSMENCKDLKFLPDSISELKCLQTFVLNGCLKLAKLPPWNGLNSLKRLMLNGKSMVRIPGAQPSLSVEWKVENLENLENLPLLDFKSLQLLDIRNFLKLVKIPPLNGLTSLKKLHLFSCGITEFPTELPLLLVDLTIDLCSNFKILPDNICELKGLETLALTYCSSLVKLPPLKGLNSLKVLEIISIGITEIPSELPSSLVHLKIVCCGNLKILPANMFVLKCLQTLHLNGCLILKKLPPLDGLKSLEKLDLSETAIVEIPAELPPSLMMLKLENCRFLRILPSNIFGLKNFEINLHGCSNLFKLLPLDDLQPLLVLSATSSKEISNEITIRSRLSYRVGAAIRKRIKRLQKH
ncbi:disease resistance protein RPV1-like isoform X2 [Euphorbia lathyris]|uniref:disease resistance protein RPV1-like isoform X2 n=1 Tax=Euphorbia lathyris TaxID=212925 RepID=UPI003313A881